MNYFEIMALSDSIYTWLTGNVVTTDWLEAPLAALIIDLLSFDFSFWAYSPYHWLMNIQHLFLNPVWSYSSF